LDYNAFEFVYNLIGIHIGHDKIWKLLNLLFGIYFNAKLKPVKI
jgi:hypothetical protein